MILMGMIRNLIFLLLFSLVPLHSFAQQKEPIGRVLITRGNVEAIDTSGTPRSLRRRSEIYEGESINTESDGFAQIRMIDAALIAINTDSTFTIIEYRYHNDPAIPDIATLELSSGGFRTITGAIGDSPDDEYELRTKLATVGTGGTTYECVIESNNDADLYCGVDDGGIAVTNSFGSVSLGLGASHDYAKVQQGMPPEPLLQIPQQLGSDTFNQSSSNNYTSNNAQQIPNSITTTSPGPGFPAPIPITIKPYKNSNNP